MPSLKRKWDEPRIPENADSALPIPSSAQATSSTDSKPIASDDILATTSKRRKIAATASNDKEDNEIIQEMSLEQTVKATAGLMNIQPANARSIEMTPDVKTTDTAYILPANAAPLPQVGKKRSQGKGRTLDPALWPVRIDPKSSVNAAVQSIIWWSDYYRFDWMEVADLYAEAGYAKERDGTLKDRVSQQAMEKQYRKYFAQFYSERNVPLPEKANVKKRAKVKNSIRINIDGEDRDTSSNKENEAPPDFETRDAAPREHISPASDKGWKENLPEGVEYLEALADRLFLRLSRSDKVAVAVDLSPISLKANDPNEMRFRESLCGSQIAFHFQNADGSTRPDDHPPTLDAALAVEHSHVLSAMLHTDPDMQCVVVNDGIEEGIVRLLIWCLSIGLESSPPHGPVFMGQDNAMPLYFLAADWGCPHVMDMVTDYFHFRARNNVGNLNMDKDTLNRIADLKDAEFLNFWIDALGLMSVKEWHSHIYYDPIGWWNTTMRDSNNTSFYREANGRLHVKANAVCNRYHHHDTERGEPCYRQYDEVRRIRDQEYAQEKQLRATQSNTEDRSKTIGLYRKMFHERNKLKRARLTGNTQGFVDARATLLRMQELLREAAHDAQPASGSGLAYRTEETIDVEESWNLSNYSYPRQKADMELAAKMKLRYGKENLDAAELCC